MSVKSEKMSQERLEALVNKLRTEIVNGLRPPGSYLPAESSLAKQFGMGNKSVRKGLEQLAQEGLIVKIDRVGSMVAEPETQTITLNLGWQQTMAEDAGMDALLADFEKRNPAIRVRKVAVDFYRIESAKSMLESGLIDALLLNSRHCNELAEAGGLDLLEPLAADAALYPIAQEAFEAEGRLYARPLAFSPVVLCYNKDHFREAGIAEPDGYWTWDDLVRAGRILTRQGERYGFYFQPESANRYPVFLLQAAADEAYRAGIRLMNDLVTDRELFPNYFGVSNDETNQLFAQGKVSMLLTTYFHLNRFQGSGIRYDISPIPAMEHKGRQETLLLTMGIAMVRFSKEKEAARRLIEYLASGEAQLRIARETTSIPARWDMSDQAGEPGTGKPPRYQLFREWMGSYRHHSEIGLRMGEIRELSRMLKTYWSGMLDEEELYRALGDWKSGRQQH